MKTKIIIFPILMALLFSPALNCAFAGDAFSSLQSASISPNAAFDGSKSYSGSFFGMKSASKTIAVKDDAPPEEPEQSDWEKLREKIKENKPTIFMCAVGAGVGFLLAGPGGAAIGAASMLLFLLFADL